MADNRHVTKLRENLRTLVRRLGILERGEAYCCGVTLAQCHVLIELGKAEKPSVNDLAETLRLDKSTVSRSIDTLVSNRLVLREPDPEDRRFVTLRLSAEGIRLYTDLEKRMDEYFAEIVDVLPADKREQVIDSLILLAEAVKNPNCCNIGPANPGCGGKEVIQNV